MQDGLVESGLPAQYDEIGFALRRRGQILQFLETRQGLRFVSQ